jgi:hypothetical protein
MTDPELLRRMADKLESGEESRKVAGVVLARLALEMMGKKRG